MKKFVGVLCLFLALVTGCVSSTPYGECIGVNDQQTPTLRYKASVRNIVIGSIFIGTVFVPLIILFNELECPVGPR